MYVLIFMKSYACFPDLDDLLNINTVSKISKPFPCNLMPSFNKSFDKYVLSVSLKKLTKSLVYE